MRIAVVGPTHPYKGGVAQHTTELVRRLSGAGHDVDMVSWSAQYPARLYPGAQRVTGPPEVEPWPGTSYPLAWWRPDGWWRTGRQLRAYDAVVLVVVTPLQAPAHLVVAAGLGRSSRSRPRVVALCHNVLPHEARRLDEPLMRALLRRADGVLTHSTEQAALARTLTRAPVSVARLPAHLPDDARTRAARPAYDGPPRLLFFGIVRPYKGLDVLLHALARVPGPTLTVAGEFWGGQAGTARLVGELGLGRRVQLRPGYVPAADLPALFAAADAVVLPYHSGTASQNVELAFGHGLPVVATRAGSLSGAVHDGVDGLLCEPGDVGSLATALGRLAEPGTLDRLRDAVRPVDPEPAWSAYVESLFSLAGVGPERS